MALSAFAAMAAPAAAQEIFAFNAPGADKSLRDALERASVIVAARQTEKTGPQDLFAAARAEYGRLLGALYAEGYYAGVISIRIDGRETADIPALDAPETIRSIVVTVEPGPRFRFAAARMRPYAPGTEIPPRYGDGRVARSTAIGDAAKAGVDGWRNIGHAKARVAGQEIIADHPRASIASLILLDPGPRVRFGRMSMQGYDRLRPERLAEIAGFPTGEVFSPAALETVTTRLQRTGIFSAIALNEAERVNPDGTLDIGLVVTEETPRRFGFGAEIASLEGLTVSGYWLHRNLFGGGERLRFDAEISGIGGQTDETDYDLSARIERPATFTPDTTAFAEIAASRIDDQDFDADRLSFEVGLSRVVGRRLEGSLALAYIASDVTDAAGTTRYRQIALPFGLTYDARDKPLDAKDGYYISGEIKPFLGLSGTGSGARLVTDARAFRSFGAEDGLVLAGRAQAGTIVGPSLATTPREDLFYTGGGGSVRGQPFQSLGVQVLQGGTVASGGQSFVALSGEARVAVNERLGVVAFVDVGSVGSGSFLSGSSDWHAGAGIGLRYQTGIGPIRLDVAAPVSGSTGDGVQIYVGIGQAF